MTVARVRESLDDNTTKEQMANHVSAERKTSSEGIEAIISYKVEKGKRTTDYVIP